MFTANQINCNLEIQKLVVGNKSRERIRSKVLRWIRESLRRGANLPGYACCRLNSDRAFIRLRCTHPKKKKRPEPSECGAF